MENVEDVFLICMEDLKNTNRLRVCVLSSNYQNKLNCSFPKNIRKENRLYLVKLSFIEFVRMTYNDFYKVTAPSESILIIDDDDERQMRIDRIYSDDNCTECCLCLENEKFFCLCPLLWSLLHM